MAAACKKQSASASGGSSSGSAFVHTDGGIIGVHCFENNKGGLQWAADMIDLMKQYRLHFCYHSYHEHSFGLYYGYGTLPDPNNANQPLIDLITQKLQ